jgi:hypothetical protein
LRNRTALSDTASSTRSSGLVGARGRAEDAVAKADRGIRGEHRLARPLALDHPFPAGFGLRQAYALHVIERRLAGGHVLVDVAPARRVDAQQKQFVIDLDLLQQLAPAQAARREIDVGRGDQHVYSR